MLQRNFVSEFALVTFQSAANVPETKTEYLVVTGVGSVGTRVLE